MASVRRLSAIMFTDMVGSTAAAQANESEALRLRDEQAVLVRSLLAVYHGREVKSMGDGFLAEFDSALHAVQCAVDIQQHLQKRNSQPGLAPIRLRIGIHLGDVEPRASDIVGDAVNIASRIEPLAAPGGICISGEVFSQVRNKIPNQLEKLAPTPLKGVESAVDLYRVVLPWASPGLRSSATGPVRLAVLPFSNMSTDPADVYFADGLTEELITVLSQFRELRVIARTSVMQYKSTSKGVSQIGSELRVSSVLEGSVRKAGNRLRVTAQLIDVESEGHTWARSYDRELDDVFQVQAELAQQVAEALKVELRPKEAERLSATPNIRADSYLAYLKGRTLLHPEPSRSGLEAAKQQFELAISLDSQNAAAYSGLADTLRMMGWWHPDISRAERDAASRRAVMRAIELDPDLAEAHASLGILLWDNYDYVGAEKELKLAVTLNPSYALAHNMYSYLLQDQGRVDEALVEFALAEEADPHWSLDLHHFTQLLIWLGRFDAAWARIEKLRKEDEDSFRLPSALFEYYLGRGDLTRCLEEGHKLERMEDEDRHKEMRQALHAAISGDKEKARAILRQLESLPYRPESAHDFARVYAELGDLDDCFRWLDQGYETGNVAFQSWRLDPRMSRVREDPRFAVLSRRMNLA
jgi:adenylate cyclase